MTTTPVEETQAPAPENTETAPAADEMLVQPDAATSTDTLPSADPTPKPDSPDGDVKSEPEPGKAPEAKADDTPPTLETLAADVTNLTERNSTQETAHQTQVTELKEANRLAEERATEAEKQTSQGQLAQRVINFRDSQIAKLRATREDLDEADVQAEAVRLTQVEWDRYQAEQATATADTRVTDLETQLADTQKLGSVDHLMRKYDVPEEQRPLVAATGTNADAAIAIATALGEAEKTRVKLEELTKAQVPADDPSQKMDVGGDLATLTDQQIFDGLGAGTHSDVAAAQKAGQRLGLI